MQIIDYVKKQNAPSKKSILLSVRPEWCRRIIKREKTVEVRKNRPVLKPPFKCYIYCTKSKSLIYVGEENNRILGNKTIIGEFICDRIEYLDMDSVGVGFWTKGSFTYIADLGWNTGLTLGEFVRYTEGTMAFGWHISDLKIYDKPKKLSDFVCRKPLSRPPQNWCYVNSFEGGKNEGF